MSSDAPVRVLQVLACDDVGGTETMVRTLVERLNPSRVTADLATLAAPGPIAAALAGAGVRVESLGGEGLARAAWRLAGLLHRRRYDVVNAYGLKASMIARVLTRGLQPTAIFICGVRGLHVTEVEDLRAPKARIALALERLGAPLVDIYDANSLGALELLASVGIGRDHLHYIPNGLDVNRWSMRDEAWSADRPPVVLCVARFVARKRHEDLLRAVALLRRQGMPVRAVLAGDGPTLQTCRQLAHRLGIAGDVAFPGAIDSSRVSALLGEATAFCLPSLWEGMPGAVMEAMAAGVPVVGTDVNGTRDLMVDGESGLLVPALEPERLATALRDVLTDPLLARRLASGARRRVDERFTIERMVEAKEQLYVHAARAA